MALWQAVERAKDKALWSVIATLFLTSSSHSAHVNIRPDAIAAALEHVANLPPLVSFSAHHLLCILFFCGKNSILNLLYLVELGKVCMCSERVLSDNSSFFAQLNESDWETAFIALPPVAWCQMLKDSTVLCEALLCFVSLRFGI